MRFTTLIPLLFLFSHALAQELTVKDVFKHLEARYELKLIYSNEVLILPNNEVALVRFTPNDYSRDEIFMLLRQTLGLRFEAMTDRPKQFVVRPRQSIVEDRLQAIQRSLQAVEREQRALSAAIRENKQAIEQVQEQLTLSQDR